MAHPRAWHHATDKASFVISTDRTRLDLPFINDAFATEDMYWAKRLPEEQLSLMLDKSLTFGLYRIHPAMPPAASASEPSSPRTPSPTLEAEAEDRWEQIGMARLVTDFVSTAYLTDVFVSPDVRDLGLGKWLIRCVKEEFEGMGAFRRAFCMASPGVGEEFYKRELNFHDVADEKDDVKGMTRRGW